MKDPDVEVIVKIFLGVVAILLFWIVVGLVLFL